MQKIRKQCIDQAAMKKIFFVAGELSGDKIAQWYCHKKFSGKSYTIEAVGGEGLEQAGATLYVHYATLNLTGIVEIIKKLPFIFSFLHSLVKHIVRGKFDEVVLVDFPGFNLMLARRLKKRVPGIKITYVSPPQLWCWGAWRVKKLRRWCDDVVVMYPFEQEWYRKRGVHARWLGSPVYQRMKPFFAVDRIKEKKVALLPASRHHELDNLLPICVEFIRKLSARVADVSYVLPLASSLSKDLVEKALYEMGVDIDAAKVRIVTDEKEKIDELSSSCLAFTKPGTVTLELALLGIPTIMFFKTSAINYFLGKQVVQVEHMALPNLLLEKPLYKEFVQDECDVDAMVAHAQELLDGFEKKDERYAAATHDLLKMREVLQTCPKK